jgi:hypothetical protein
MAPPVRSACSRHAHARQTDAGMPHTESRLTKPQPLPPRRDPRREMSRVVIPLHTRCASRVAYFMTS